MVMVHIFGLMEILTIDHGLMETSLQVILKMVKCMAKDHIFIPTEMFMSVIILMVINTVME